MDFLKKILYSTERKDIWAIYIVIPKPELIYGHFG